MKEQIVDALRSAERTCSHHFESGRYENYHAGGPLPSTMLSAPGNMDTSAVVVVGASLSGRRPTANAKNEDRDFEESNYFACFSKIIHKAGSSFLFRFCACAGVFYFVCLERGNKSWCFLTETSTDEEIEVSFHHGVHSTTGKSIHNNGTQIG